MRRCSAAWADRRRGNLHKRDLSSQDVNVQQSCPSVAAKFLRKKCRLSSFFSYFFFSNRISPAIVSQLSLALRVSSVAKFLHQNLVYLSGFFFRALFTFSPIHITEECRPPVKSSCSFNTLSLSRNSVFSV